MRKVIVAIFGVVSIGLFGACGDDGDTTTPDATPNATTPTAPTSTVAAVTTTAAATTAGTASGSVRLGDTKYGKVLADETGRALYLFTNDVKGKSNCVGTCATTWPAYAPAAITAGAGIEATKLASIDNAGKKQVTIDGVPLYTFSGDTKAGDTNGQGVGGIWYLVDSTGKPIK